MKILNGFFISFVIRAATFILIIELAELIINMPNKVGWGAVGSGVGFLFLFLCLVVALLVDAYVYSLTIEEEVND